MPPKPPTKPRAPKKSTRHPKQVISKQDRLKRWFSTLYSQIDGSHFGNAVKTCDKILRVEPDDKDALQTKLFLLLQTERYSNALSLLDTLQETASFGFERAYTLYRLQREHQAQQVLDTIPEKENNRGIVHLEAQLNYREGSYEAAIDLYNQLLDTAEPNSEEHSDILTNLQASQQHLDFIESGYLRILDALPASLVSGLEASNPPAPPQPHPIHLITADPKVAQQQQPVKKVRTRRVPAGVVPGVTPPPDPERWLKKGERSNFGMGKKGKKAGYGMGATQGSVETPVPTVTTTAPTTPAKSTRSKKKK